MANFTYAHISSYAFQFQLVFRQLISIFNNSTSCAQPQTTSVTNDSRVICEVLSSIRVIKSDEEKTDWFLHKFSHFYRFYDCLKQTRGRAKCGKWGPFGQIDDRIPTRFRGILVLNHYDKPNWFRLGSNVLEEITLCHIVIHIIYFECDGILTVSKFDIFLADDLSIYAVEFLAWNAFVAVRHNLNMKIWAWSRIWQSEIWCNR